ncbi:MAG: glycosyl hydrolase-related protein [Candidatus Omnitrophica bacterium]|nr:glycosyl hydrolase-related protein [Candidatus Omnitrophota bacterium]
MIQDWIAASDDTLGITLSSCVSVFGFVDPTTDPTRQPMLQPVLLATRWMGKAYAQAGSHHYRFSLTSYSPREPQFYRFGSQVNHPLIAITPRSSDRTGVLPEIMSFCSIDPPNLIISTIKKCEDDNDVVVRCHEVEGKDSEARLRFAFPIAAAQKTGFIEERGKEIPAGSEGVSFPVGHNAIETLKLKPGPSLAP